MTTEAQWQTTVLELATLRGWRHYHTHNSRRSVAGFPDLVLVRGTRIVFAELKTDTGKPTAEQLLWLDDLEHAATAAPDVVSVHLWRPADWPTVVEVLR